MGKSVGLQFSYRMTYERWVEQGFDIRERAYHGAFRRHGYDVSFISYDARTLLHTTEEGIGCYGLARAGRRRRIPLLDYLCELAALLRLVSEKDIGILKTNQFTGAFHAVPVRLLTGCRVIVRCGYGWMQGRLRRQKSLLRRVAWFPLCWLVECAAFWGADAIVVASDAHAHHLARFFPFFSRKCTVIRNYIDTGFFRPAGGERNGRVLFAGRLLQQKNVAPLIRACAGLGLELVVVGSGNDEERLRRIASEGEGRVTFAGRVPPAEVCALMRSCSIFVLPSLHEGSPKALLEAMACAMVVVATRVVGCMELIDDGVSGFLCDTTEASIAEALRRAAGLDSVRAAQMGALGREFVLENCSFDAVMRQEVALLRSLKED